MDGLRNAVSQGPGLVIFRILVFVLLAYVLYSLYNWLNGGVTDLKDYILYSSPNKGLPASSTRSTVYTGANVPGIYPGGEFSVSTWIYINDWSINNGGNKVFLTLSGGGTGSDAYKTMVMYLGKRINRLGVALSYGDTSTLIKESRFNLIKSSTAPFNDEGNNTDSDFKGCDIESINLQKWVNITAAVSGRTVDIYIDGKLSRSCVLPGMYSVDSGDSPTLELGGFTQTPSTETGTTGQNRSTGFGGYIGQTRVANFAYSPDQVYKHYLSGPFDNSMWALLMNQINPSQYSFNIQRDGQNVLGGQT